MLRNPKLRVVGAAILSAQRHFMNATNRRPSAMSGLDASNRHTYAESGEL